MIWRRNVSHPKHRMQALLLECLRKPKSAARLTDHEWPPLIQMARASKLLAHLGGTLERSGIIRHLPAKAVQHFKAANVIADYRKRLALWELNRLWRALLDRDVEIAVLKGGAYFLSELPMAEGRLVADVDLLVDRGQLERTEKALIENGWRTLKLDAYDQRYYREWMHEIPPMRHRERLIEVDVHHTILPLTSRLRPDPALLLRDAIDVGRYGFKVLAPCDMVLHSCAHLFHDSALNDTLRDLVDLDQLFRHFSRQDTAFWIKLAERARELQLRRPLFYACRFTQRLLNTPIPDEIWSELNPDAPSVWVRYMMDRLVPLALLPEHPDYPSKTVAIARWLLYVRSHYLRMPLRLLIPHLIRKSRQGQWSEKTDS